jgi:hypothetical protein
LVITVTGFSMRATNFGAARESASPGVRHRARAQVEVATERQPDQPHRRGNERHAEQQQHQVQPQRHVALGLVLPRALERADGADRERGDQQSSRDRGGRLHSFHQEHRDQRHQHQHREERSSRRGLRLSAPRSAEPALNPTANATAATVA